MSTTPSVGGALRCALSRYIRRSARQQALVGLAIVGIHGGAGAHVQRHELSCEGLEPDLLTASCRRRRCCSASARPFDASKTTNSSPP